MTVRAPTAAATGFRLERLIAPPAPDDATDVRGGQLPPGLSERYDGPLEIPLRRDRPTIIANFVSTLDGVVALDAEGRTGGGEVSGFYEPDRFVMGLLRALADVVLVGAGTVRAAPDHEWTPRRVHRASTNAYDAFRREAGVESRQPTTMVVTASGGLDPAHRGLSAEDVPVVVLTTAAGARRLDSAPFRSNVTVEAGGDATVSAATIVDHAARRGARLILCEGGPHLIADLLADGLLDELFLTVAPQIVGRDEATSRLALVEGRAFPIGGAPWASLRSAHRSIDHLFLRYAFDADAFDTRDTAKGR